MEQEKINPARKVFIPRDFDSNHSKRRNKWRISTKSRVFLWSNPIERIEITRQGLPVDSIEEISTKAAFPIVRMIQLIGLPQTTYNKKKRGNELLGRKESEIVLVLSELLDFGLDVFNNESEKFQRWLQKPNLSLGGVTPESLFDSQTGIQEVKNCLNQLEFGNMA